MVSSLYMPVRKKVCLFCLGDELVPNPTVAFALKQRVTNRFLDTLGAASALHVRWSTGLPRDHAVFTRRRLVRA